MALAAQDVESTLWRGDSNQIWGTNHRDLLAHAVYFDSAFLTTEQLSRALAILETSPEVWFMPSQWSSSPLPTSMLWSYPPADMCCG